MEGGSFKNQSHIEEAVKGWPPRKGSELLITNVKEINKEFSLAKKHFNNAINMAKKGVVVGEINFPGKINFPAGEPMPDVSLHNRKPRKKRSKKNDPEDRGIVQNVPDDLLPDLDKPKKR